MHVAQFFLIIDLGMFVIVNSQIAGFFIEIDVSKSMSLSINNPFVESCRDSKSKQPECLQVFVHPASVYAGLQK